MHGRSGWRVLGCCASLVAAGALLPAPAAQAQIAGENVNMVSGIGWPGGDPFLQRQNEPTMAVSSANPMHLMAGANDYRTVDIKVPAGDVTKINGDAWLGVFKSLDGGQTWKSVLLPGYPQDPHCLAPPADPVATDPSRRRHHKHCKHKDDNTDPVPTLCDLPASADPVMRAGTDGMFYFGGINFQRDKLRSRVFLARYLDLNNREAGDATRGTDPIRYVDTRIIAENPPNVFIDKPWIAVDVPRPGAAICEIPVEDGPNPATRRFLGGTIYASWAEFTLPDDLPTTTSTIKFTYSRDCGKTWVTPYKLNTGNSKLSQGVAIAIEPITGRVYVAWRRIRTPFHTQADAIMVTRSEGRKKHFANPRVLARIQPFDQGTSDTAFRTEALPTMAISSDGASSWAHVAWQQRKNGGVYESRIVMSTSKVHPPPAGDQDDDEHEDVEDETRLVWSAPAVVDEIASADDAGNSFTSGHQVMPALTYGQGRLMLVYYDTRFDHTRRYYKPRIPFAPSDGRFYEETLAPVGELARPEPPDDVPPSPLGVFNAWLNDGSLFRVRHTVDVRVAAAPAGQSPVFTSVLTSKFPFGMRGDEASHVRTGLKVPGFGTSEVTVVTAPDAAQGQTQGSLAMLQQLQVNPPNYPMFKNGTKAFLGDYIDIQGPAFVPTAGGGWAFNLAPTPAPVFHAVWTSNQDVQVPRVLDAQGYPDWSQYAPPYCPTCSAPQASRYANDGRPADACVPGAEASRDQNIYTARITEGLLVATPQNMKPLSPTTTRAFVVAAQNTTARDMTVTFAAAVPEQGPTFAVPEALYAFTADLAPASRSLTVVVPARSYVSRSLFARLTGSNANPLTTIQVTVTETGCTACRSGFVTLNPATALGSLVQPDTALPVADIGSGDLYASKMADGGLAAPSWTNVEWAAPSWTNPSWTNYAPNPSWTNPSWTNPSWTNPSWTNPSWTNPSLTNANWVNPSWTNPSWTNPSWTNPSWTNPASSPSWTNPSWTNPSWTNPSWTNPSWTNPSWTNPSWTNPSWTNPSWTNPSWTNSSMSDLSYTITNTGNTTTSYHVKVVGTASSSTPAIQFGVTKSYATPGAVNCRLIEFPRFLPVVEVPDISGALVDPGSQVDPGTGDGAASNATVVLAPGESALVTLRAAVPLLQMAELGARLGVAAVPAGYVNATGTTYQDLAQAGTGATVGVGTASATSLSYDPASAVAAVTVSGGATPTGAISFVRNGTMLTARWPLSGGTTQVSLSPPLAPGETLAAFYPGDATHAASLSSTYARPTGSATATTLITTPTVWTATGLLVLQAQVSSLGPSMDMFAAVVGGARVAFTVDGVTTFVAMSPAGGTRVTLEVPALGNGTHSISARFEGFGEFQPSDSATLTQTVGAPVLFFNATAGSQLQPPQAPYQTINVTVTDAAGSRIPSAGLIVRLTSSADPANPRTVPAFAGGGEGYFSAQASTLVPPLSFSPGDQLTLVIADTATGASSTGQVAMPGYAALTAPAPGALFPSGAAVPVAWSYTGADPTQFWIWTGPSVLMPAGSFRGTTFVPTSLPATLQITAVNLGSAPAGSVFAARTDDNLTRQVGLATAPLQTPSTLAASGSASYAILPSGRALAWGTNHGGQLGTGQIPGVVQPVPTFIPTPPAALLSISARAWQGQAIDSEGGLHAWGWGENIGQPAVENAQLISYGTFGAGTVVATSAGMTFGLALRSDGTVVGFGQEASGQLGPAIGSGSARAIPGLDSIVGISAGFHHGLALRADGTVWAWGGNDFGQLGDGTVTPRSAPQQVAGLGSVVAVAAGDYFSAVLLSDGTVRAWGHNNVGQLGDGTLVDAHLPVQVSGLTGVSSLRAGGNHALALLASGTIRAWGYNGSGQLGDGTADNRSLPVTVSGLTGVVEVVGGEWHSLARLADGTVWAWGENAAGQLDPAAGATSAVPVRVAGIP